MVSARSLLVCWESGRTEPVLPPPRPRAASAAAADSCAEAVSSRNDMGAGWRSCEWAERDALFHSARGGRLKRVAVVARWRSWQRRKLGRWPLLAVHRLVQGGSTGPLGVRLQSRFGRARSVGRSSGTGPRPSIRDLRWGFLSAWAQLSLGWWWRWAIRRLNYSCRW